MFIQYHFCIMVGVTLLSNSLFDFPGINDLGLSRCVSFLVLN